MFVQFKNHYKPGEWILVNSAHVTCATPTRSLDGQDVTILYFGAEEILVAHSLDQVHKAFDGGLIKCD